MRRQSKALESQSEESPGAKEHVHYFTSKETADRKRMARRHYPSRTRLSERSTCRSVKARDRGAR